MIIIGYCLFEHSEQLFITIALDEMNEGAKYDAKRIVKTNVAGLIKFEMKQPWKC